jgi:hypothetical protein
VDSGRTGKSKYSRGGNRTGIPQVLKPAANELGWPRKMLRELKNQNSNRFFRREDFKTPVENE